MDPLHSARRCALTGDASRHDVKRLRRLRVDVRPRRTRTPCLIFIARTLLRRETPLAGCSTPTEPDDVAGAVGAAVVRPPMAKFARRSRETRKWLRTLAVTVAVSAALATAADAQTPPQPPGAARLETSVGYQFLNVTDDPGTT